MLEVDECLDGRRAVEQPPHYQQVHDAVDAAPQAHDNAVVHNRVVEVLVLFVVAQEYRDIFVLVHCRLYDVVQPLPRLVQAVVAVLEAFPGGEEGPALVHGPGHRRHFENAQGQVAQGRERVSKRCWFGHGPPHRGARDRGTGRRGALEAEGRADRGPLRRFAGEVRSKPLAEGDLAARGVELA